MTATRVNFDSYNSAEVVDYYGHLSDAGLFKHEEQLIDRFFKPSGRTLDVGCGAGRTTAPLHQSGYEVTGIDYSPAMILKARASYPSIDFRMGSILDTEFLDGEFDNVLFSFNGLMLLETYEDRLAAVREVRRILKDGMNFIFTTPFLDNKLRSNYWKEKASNLGIDLGGCSRDQFEMLGDEVLDDFGNSFALHIPLISEIAEMVFEGGMTLVFGARRLDFNDEGTREDELDDNYLCVARKIGK